LKLQLQKLQYLWQILALS